MGRPVQPGDRRVFLGRRAFLGSAALGAAALAAGGCDPTGDDPAAGAGRAVPFQGPHQPGIAAPWPASG